MKLKFRDLWSSQGEIARGPFLAWGLVLFGVKYNIDRLIVRYCFGRDWSVFSYFDQPLPGAHLLTPAQNSREYFVLLLFSLPFLWVGIALCLKRLESARLPAWLGVLFVAPIVKWFLFVALVLMPERTEREDETPGIAAWLPESKWSSAVLAAGLSAMLVLGACVLSTVLLREYGWALFVGAPFAIGFFAAIVYGARQPRGLRETMAVAAAAVTLAGAAILAVAVEGAMCLVMAAPLAYGLALLGALGGHGVCHRFRKGVPPQLLCVPLLALPLMLGTETMREEGPPLFKVVSSVEVNAPVEVVWKHVVEFSELPPPKEFIFKCGIAYPMVVF
jgi:uncharacterized membrane protein YhaH (DUF805 family)